MLEEVHATFRPLAIEKPCSIVQMSGLRNLDATCILEASLNVAYSGSSSVWRGSIFSGGKGVEKYWFSEASSFPGPTYLCFQKYGALRSDRQRFLLSSTVKGIPPKLKCVVHD